MFLKINNINALWPVEVRGFLTGNILAAISMEVIGISETSRK